MRKAVVIFAAALALASVAAVPTAGASRFIKTGIFDDAQILYGDPDKVFPMLKSLNTQVIRVNLYWGGPAIAVARERPRRATNPADPAYDWATYDRTVRYANAYGMTVMFSIIGTPSWANGGRAANVAPTRAVDLRNFARAAARRYGGTFVGPDGNVVPAVRFWLAWSEPNNPNFLAPQWAQKRGAWVVQSAIDYARICNAIVDGVHAIQLSRGKVACGVTGPRGNNQPGSARPSVSPLVFLSAMKKAGARGFDAYAHHPYYGAPSETPSTPPPPGKRGVAPTAVTLGNLSVLKRALKASYGNVRLWITEYGYQTNPPDPGFGVSYTRQARYLKEAFAKAKADKSVDMFVWFLVQDETLLSGWQSGLVTTNGKRKPSYKAFQGLRG